MTLMSRPAADAYRRLAADPDRAGLRAAVDDVLDQLDSDPSRPALSRRVLAAPVWGGRAAVVVVRGPDEDWLVVWRRQDDGRPKVGYLGPTASLG